MSESTQAWGHSTEALTEDEKATLRGLGCQQVDYEIWGPEGPETFPNTWVSHDGGYLTLGYDDSCPSNGYLRWLITHSIRPEKAHPGSRSASVGFSDEGGGRWYGWSHRAALYFEIGDRLYSEDAHQALYDLDPYLADLTPYKQIGPEITTLDEARTAARNFAGSVS